MDAHNREIIGWSVDRRMTKVFSDKGNGKSHQKKKTDRFTYIPF